MISDTQLRHDLLEFKKEYDAAYSSNQLSPQVYFSKLGVIELAGWVEYSFDEIANISVDQSALSRNVRNRVAEAIRLNYGFQYWEHFMRMMSTLIGVAACDAMHNALGAFADVLAAELNSINQQRRVAAHTHIAGTTMTFDAPGTTLRRLNVIYPVMCDIYKWVNNNR